MICIGSYLAQKNNLEKLTLWNQGNVDSIIPLSKWEHLTTLNIWEQTKIIDGEISFFKSNAKSKENRYRRIYTLPLKLINQFANYHYLCTLKPKNIYQWKKPFLYLPFNSINKNDMKYFITFLLFPFLAAAQPVISSIDVIKPYADFQSPLAFEETVVVL